VRDEGNQQLNETHFVRDESKQWLNETRFVRDESKETLNKTNLLRDETHLSRDVFYLSRVFSVNLYENK
jgi:hypothetical protein